ncbi:MAG: GH3 auxin-responsive promoter family protein [Candidatus Bathyarchaeia archaeon]|jgi:hypothetical protein
MKGNSLWKRYCSFFEKPFSEQMEYNTKQIELYFHKWKNTDIAKMTGHEIPKKLQDVPVTTYDNYPMLVEFSRKIDDAVKRKAKKQGELFKSYYEHITREIGSSLSRYMPEPYYFSMKTTGTTGESKWVVHGETFWNNFRSSAVTSAIIACSDEWGETKVKSGDKALNVTAPIPYLSGWAAWASQTQFKLIPPIEVTDNLQSIKDAYLLMFKAIEKGEKIALGGGLGSMFYMICKYFVEPEEFYRETFNSMKFGLTKTLLILKLLQFKLSKKEKKNIVEYIPLKGVLIGGLDSRLYIDFFKKEFGLEPLNNYGSTEVGSLMRGDPDRKSDLVPDLRVGYLEFKTEEGQLRRLDEVKKGESYDLVVTPFGSIFFRYDMEDFFKVIDFRDDGMPILAFEGRKIAVIDIYGFRVSPNVVAQALFNAGLRSSDKWAVTKLLKPREHLHFFMEKTWSHSERNAEKIIFHSLMEIDKVMPHRGRTLRDYVIEFKIENPSEVITVEYLKPGAFLRYAMMKARAGSPLGQYKPPKIIPSDRSDIHEALTNA